MISGGGARGVVEAGGGESGCSVASGGEEVVSVHVMSVFMSSVTPNSDKKVVLIGLASISSKFFITSVISLLISSSSTKSVADIWVSATFTCSVGLITLQETRIFILSVVYELSRDISALHQTVL